MGSNNLRFRNEAHRIQNIVEHLDTVNKFEI